MIKKISFLVLCFFAISNFVYAAEKIPVLITPDQIISTNHDEVEVGDDIDFKVVKDVYKDDTLFIKKGAPVIADVDYVCPNDWLGDSAYIQFKKFKVLDFNHKWVNVNYCLNISGSDCKSPNLFLKSAKAIISVVRGQEVFLTSKQQNFNIFILN